MVKYILGLFTLLILVGCGADNQEIDNLKKSENILKKQLEQQAIKLNGLNTKVQALEDNMKRLKLNNTQLHQLIEKIRKTVHTAPTRDTNRAKASESDTALRKAQNRKMVFQLIRGMSNTRKPAEIAGMLNQRKLMDQNNQPWTAASVDLYMRKNTLGPYSAKK
jgi:hypothetical protein